LKGLVLTADIVQMKSTMNNKDNTKQCKELAADWEKKRETYLNTPPDITRQKG